MFSQNLDPSAANTERKAGALAASFVLHVFCLGILGLLGMGVVFSKVVVVKGRPSGVDMLTYTAASNPGGGEPIVPQPDTSDIVPTQIVILQTHTASKIPATGTLRVEAIGLDGVQVPIAPNPIDHVWHGPCGCVAHWPDPQAPQSQLREAVLVKKVDPQYPLFARKVGIQGTVVVHAMINREGAVTDISVMSGRKELRQAAVEAIRQWRYQPYVLDGTPVEIETTITVNFDLRSSPGLSRMM